MTSSPGGRSVEELERSIRRATLARRFAVAVAILAGTFDAFARIRLRTDTRLDQGRWIVVDGIVRDPPQEAPIDRLLWAELALLADLVGLAGVCGTLWFSWRIERLHDASARARTLAGMDATRSARVRVLGE